jgi:conjugative transfer relaxase protein TraI
MLSTESIKNANQARHYFLGEDNYYTKENDATEKSQWWGKGAVLLGLKGEVNPLTFTELLQGKLPNGQQLGVIQNNKLKHRPGFDLTFSVPKSVSLVALLGEDTRIYGVVQQAVDRTLERIEQCATARVTRQGVTAYENTHNLVVAKFLHDISREGDPQLHVHCAVMNMTKRSDNLWRSLASQSGKYGAQVTKEILGFFEHVRHHQQYYGLLFRAELAHELKQLGYDLEKKGKGFFEIVGFSQATLVAYSKRRQQVVACLQEQGYSGAKAAAVATLKTRKPKNINRETLNDLWQTRSKEQGVDGYGEAKAAFSNTLNPQKANNAPLADRLKAKEALQWAMRHLSETEVTFPEVQLINVALQYTLADGINLKTLIQAMHDLQVSSDLVLLSPSHPSRGPCFTTQKLLYYEQKILEAINKEHPSQQPLLLDQKLKAYLLANDDLNGKQKRAIRALFTSKQQLFAIESPTSLDKASLFKPLIELTKLGGYQSIVLTPNKISQVQIKASIQPASSLLNWIKKHFDFTEHHTVAHFIATQEKWLARSQNNLSKAVLFVDQATLLSSKQMHDLVQITQQTGSRLVLLGDSHTLLPWQAGNPLLQMLNAGMAQAIFNKNETDPLLHSHILSVENKLDRLERMADHYINLSQAQQKKACIFMPTRAACDEINSLIHQKLKEKNGMNGHCEVTVLLPTYLSASQSILAKHYREGQWVRFNHPCASQGLKMGKYYQVKSIKAAENVIILQNKGRSMRWNPSKDKALLNHMELFEEKKRELVIGETITWKRTDTRKKLIKGEQLWIADIRHNKIQFRRGNGKSISLSRRASEYYHFDYGYSLTPYQADTLRYDMVIAYQNSTSRQSHRRLFHKIMGQANKQVWLYTENQHQLFATLQKQAGDKATAMGALLGAESSALPYTEQKKLLEKAFIEALDSLKNKEVPGTSMRAEKAVDYALAHLSEREAAFSHKEVLLVALQHAFGQVAIQDIEKAVLNLEQQGALIRGLYSQNGIYWTTAQSLEREKRIIALACASQHKLSAMVTRDQIESYLLKTPLKQEQAKALAAIVSSQDGVLLLQGYAGTGKTTLVKQIENLLKEEASRTQTHYQLLCLAPTHTAVKELKDRGLTAQTLDSYLAHCKSRENLPRQDYRQMIVVDESSMLSNERLHDFLVYTRKTEARSLIMGDPSQYPAIGSGKPFTLLQSYLKTIQLTDIERQKEVTLQKAVREVYKGQYHEVFDTLSKHIIEIESTKEKEMRIDHQEAPLAAIAKDYLSRSSLERSQTLLITLGNDERVALNTMIRKGLKQTNKLQGNQIEATVLVNKNKTSAQKREVSNYQLKDIIRFNYYDKFCGIEKNDYLTVLAIQENFLLLQKEEGQQIAWNPERNGHQVEVYTEARRELLVGDLISWTRSDKGAGLFSRELAQVEAVYPQFCKVRPLKTEKSEEGLITLFHQERKFQHWDHAYAVTGYTAQGKTIPSVMLYMESHRPYLASPASFLVGLTRAVQDITIYTDNKEALLTRLLNHVGSKASALELIAVNQEPSSHDLNNRLPKSYKPKGTDKEIPESLIKQVTREMAKEALAFNEQISQVYSDRALNRMIGEAPMTLCNRQSASKTIPSPTLFSPLEPGSFPRAPHLEKSADKEIEW